ncbi:MAG: T9SS type A sorting domain-containing protein [Bacteroidetes bacterium]|nr:T9SS type A sorting domain-containing protein [Bacteroidota bacterium]
MKTICFVLSLCIWSNFAVAATSEYFVENKGQVKDQYDRPRNDIQYTLRLNGIVVHIGNGALHYQVASHELAVCKEHQNVRIYRADVELINSDKYAKVRPVEKQAYYETYYTGDNNGNKANGFSRIVYQNVYPSIDWVLYIKDGHLEQDFIVRSGGDASQIHLRYSGFSSLKTDNLGNLIASTKLLDIVERAPQCKSFSGKHISAGYVVNGNDVRFKVARSDNGMIIDPSIVWGTYYGIDTALTSANCLATHQGSVYLAGVTSSAANNIATVGAHQVIYGGGQNDAFLVKLDTDGVTRLWATYYGGTGNDEAHGLACNANGDIYMAGTTSSPNNIATAGSQQFAYADSADGFLVKFNSAGSRQWGTYCGGMKAEQVTSVCVDNSGNIIIGGITASASGIATAVYQPALAGNADAFLVKYNNSGARLWGTYYGGAAYDIGQAVCVDASGNIYLSGATQSTTNIATAGAYQVALLGLSDAFVAKFSAAGARLWATYYGGEQDDDAMSLACDKNNNVFISGYTSSTTGIASPHAYQTTNGGGWTDVFLAKFNSSGAREWATYYGSNGDETLQENCLSTDDSGYAYIYGTTNSTVGIATPNAGQPAFGGDISDGFVARFNSAGERAGATYYGGSAKESAYGCIFDNGYLYAAGSSYSVNNMTTPGTFKPSFTGGGYHTATLAKFSFAGDTAVPNGVHSLDSRETTFPAFVYPNPNKGIFTLSAKINNGNKMEIEVLNILGVVLFRSEKTITSPNFEMQVDLSMLPAGRYLAKLRSNNKSSSIPFVKD